MLFRSAAVYRVVKEIPTRFSTWAPKALGCIGKLPETLHDRAIEVPLQRKSTDEKLERLSDADRQSFTTLASKAITWVNSKEVQLRAAKPEIPAGVDDRARDEWRPLLAIADVAGGHWPKTARAAAVSLSCATEPSDDSATALLLADLHEMFTGGDVRQLTTSEILQRLHSLDERPWSHFKNGRAISSFDLARLLAPFKVKSRTLRVGTGTAKGYAATSLRPVFDRYVPQPVTSAHGS